MTIYGFIVITAIQMKASLLITHIICVYLIIGINFQNK